MRSYPAHAVLVTLWGGPLDGLQVRVNPAAERIHEHDGAGREAVYTRRGDRFEYTPPQAAR